MTREQAHRAHHQDEWIRDGGAANNPRAGLAGRTRSRSLPTNQPLALVLNVLRNVERGHSETDASATTNGFHTSRERTVRMHGEEAGRSVEPRPNDPESVITQSRGGDRDHALRGIQGWDDATPEGLESGTRRMEVASGTHTSDDGFREEGIWCSFDKVGS